MKFKKKPVVIDAMQWPGHITEEIKQFTGSKLVSEQRQGMGAVGYFLKTLEGHSYILSKNDWIIKGVQGEFYPCKPDVFEQTYTPNENRDELIILDDILLLFKELGSTEQAKKAIDIINNTFNIK